MDRNTVGRLIKYERTKRKITLQELSAGVCSVSVLQRVESGERLPDYFVLGRIIERLGKSVNKLEFLYDERAYEICYLREFIENCLNSKNHQEVKTALEYYENLPEAKEPIHKQYIYKIKAVLSGLDSQKNEEAVALLEIALKETVPEFELVELNEHLLGEEEILLLLMWLEAKTKIDTSLKDLDGGFLLSYIDRICQDEEVRVNVYSKAAWVLGSLAMKQDNVQEALWYTLKGEKILTENTVLLHLPQFLDRLLCLTKKCDVEAYKEWIKQRDALKKLYEDYDESWETDNIDWWKNYRQQEVYLVSELLEQERKCLHQSQEKIADALEIDQKTISRIENGKYKPKPGTFKKVKKYLQIEREICNPRIIVEDFRLLELEREIAKLNNAWREEEAEILFQKLKAQLPMNWKENQQFVMYMEALFARQLSRISDKETIRLCWDAFKITRRDVSIEQLEQVVLTRTETFIINYISICYGRLGNREKAIELLEKVVSAYEKSKVDLRHHYPSLAVIYVNLAELYEEVDEFEKSIEQCDIGIRFDLRCKRGVNAGYLVSAKQYAMDRKSGNNADSKEAYKQAYQIDKLMRKEAKMKSLQNAYREWYGEDILD